MQPAWPEKTVPVTQKKSDDPQGVRLQKVLAWADLGSRRVCDDLIAEGRVTVNGEVAILGRRVFPDTDQVEVDGVRIGVAAGLVYYLLNKTTGVVATVSDPEGRPTVIDELPDEPRVYPVGRLDFNTEGLLILTNDGELTHRLTHPSFGVEKEYVAHVEGNPTPQVLRQLREGVELEDGMSAPAKASLVSDDVIKLIIHEGRNRQVRRMCDAVGHPVKRLVRSRIGPLQDSKLGPGEWRSLTTDEVRTLERVASGVEAYPQR